MENFYKRKSILTKTRRVETYLKYSKFKYNYLLVTSLTYLKNLDISINNIYSKHINFELMRTISLYYSSLIPNSLGLVVSNHHKSLLNKTLLDKKATSQINVNYLTTFESYHFFTKKDTFKKLILFYLSLLGKGNINYTSRYDIYVGYT